MVRRALGTVARRLLVAGGADVRGRHQRRHDLLIVCYHGVTAAASADHWLHLPARAFEAQIAHLAAHYRCLPLDDALAALAGPGLDAPAACVTFDDGYRNNRTVAAPILARHGVPATIYLNTGLLGRADGLWTTRLEFAIASSPAASLDLAALGLDQVALGAPATRSATARRLVARLKRLPRAERRQAEAAVLAAAGAGEPRLPADFTFMDWDDVRALGDSGLVTFGGHTRHHEIVSRLDDADLADEVAGSIRDVTDAVGPALSRTFAYPNGTPDDYDDRAIAMLAAAGAVGAVTTRPGRNAPGTPPYELRRVVVGAWDGVDDFRLRCAGVLNAG